MKIDRNKVGLRLFYENSIIKYNKQAQQKIECHTRNSYKQQTNKRGVELTKDICYDTLPIYL